MSKKEQLGFRAPLLGRESVRLPVLYDDGEHIALAKPFGVLVQADSWFPKLPLLVEAIRHQAAKAKPEFVRMNIARDGLWAVHDLDPEIYGPVLFTRDRAKGESLRSACGSGAFQFTYTFISRQPKTTESSLVCDLPISRHRDAPEILVSHVTGKKAETRFEKQDTMGAFQVWTAKTAYPRRHQIFLHALESGLPIFGDRHYARDSEIMLSRLKRDYRHKFDLIERPLYGGPACYLSEISCGDAIRVECPQPPRWKGLLTQLQKHSTF